jgi:hypothetical protein
VAKVRPKAKDNVGIPCLAHRFWHNDPHFSDKNQLELCKVLK